VNVFVFQNRFEAPILAGRKPHTIRGHRRDGRPRAKVGETISLRVWTGKPYRSKQREFARAVVEFAFPVRITDKTITRVDYAPRQVRLVKEWIARNDGFRDWSEMRDWFAATHGLPFEGVLVKWRLLL
jgi:hypothetical protein